jgi:hypothetical protein
MDKNGDINIGRNVLQEMVSAFTIGFAPPSPVSLTTDIASLGNIFAAAAGGSDLRAGVRTRWSEI